MILLVVPQLPPADLSANARRRLHPLAARGRIADAKKEWYGLLLAAFQNREPGMGAGIAELPWERVRITYKITWPTQRMLDYDNLLGGGLKVIADLLQAPQNKADRSYRLGLIKDDSPKCVVEAPHLLYVYKKGVSETSIQIVRVLPY